MAALPFSCPYCETELNPPEDAWYYTCTSCGKRLNLSSQFAYLRGLDAFIEGQELMEEISPRKRRIPTNIQDKRAMALFMEAYTALQVAFQAELADVQRAVGVEMMASMAQEFMHRQMVSALEVNYWNTVMIEQTAQNEYDQLKEKLTGAAEKNAPWAWVKRLRWRSRQNQLAKALTGMEEKVSLLEKQIQFTETPLARNKKWKP